MTEKMTREQLDDWYDRYLDAHQDLPILNEHDFNVFSLRFTMLFKKREYVPKRVLDLADKVLGEFLALPSEGVYEGNYISAFGMACAIQNIDKAQKAFLLIKDKGRLYDSKIPKGFFKWFEKNRTIPKKLSEFDHLIEVLEKNRNAKIPDSHWDKVRKMMVENGKRFEAEERALTPTDEDLQRRFTI